MEMIYTAKALDLLKDNFGQAAKPFFVYNGTAANCLVPDCDGLV